jgi:hypothetical protein
MNWKEFLNLTTILLFLILFGFFAYFFGNPWSGVKCDPCSCPEVSWGYPLQFYEEYRTIGALGTGGIMCETLVKDFNIISLIIDLVIWYVASVIIVFIYKKIRKIK